MQLGIPHSIFALGRVWPNPRDPLEAQWLPDDAAKAIAFVEWDAEHCPNCRQHPHEWFGDDGRELEDPPFFVVEGRCPSCELLDDWREEHREDPRHGVFPRFARVDSDEPDGDDR